MQNATNPDNLRILALDDDRDVLLTAKLVLQKAFAYVETMTDPGNLDSLLKTNLYHVILLDMNFKPGATSGIEGLRLLQQIKKVSPLTEVVIHTAYGEITIAVKAIKLGAFDFIEKPWEKEKLLATCLAAAKLSQTSIQVDNLRNRQKVLQHDAERGMGKILSVTQVMREVIQTVKKVAATDANVLILGENGTGKELVAREIHRLSSRSGETFITVDAASLSETLFESELFGHVRGAFTDAKETRVGRFELASGGTLFLDEIGNLPPGLQSKLLTVLQNRQVIKVGSNIPVNIDIRLICASNMPIYELVVKNEFRQDLLYRINTLEIKIPPLRNRKEDIPVLLEYFIEKNKRKYQKNSLEIKQTTLNTLKQYNWPGNVRELEHASERAVIMCESDELKPTDFLFEFHAVRNTFTMNLHPLNVYEAEKQLIKEALIRSGGNLAKAARELGMGRTTLYRKLKYK